MELVFSLILWSLLLPLTVCWTGEHNDPQQTMKSFIVLDGDNEYQPLLLNILDQDPEDENYDHPVPGAFDGDEILTPEQLAGFMDPFNVSTNVKRKLVKYESSLWPNAVVPWKFNKGNRRFKKEYSYQMVFKAIQMWEDNTCLRFPKLQSTKFKSLGVQHGDYLDIGAGRGCASMVGEAGMGSQPVYLRERGCMRIGTVAHEIGHAIGFYHEQSRSDRNNFVKIKMQNIKPKNFGNFRIQKQSANLAPYDLGSDMHYGKQYFTTNGKTTIDVKDPHLAFLIGQRAGLSFYDIQGANKAYKCAANCPNNIACQNGGFVLKSCACMCPDGLGGKLCNSVDPQKSKGCGGIFRIKKGETKVAKSPNFPRIYGNVKCVWLFKSPPGTTIQVKLEMEGIPQDSGLKICHHWLEIRYNLLGQPGPRYCGRKSNGLAQNIKTIHNTILFMFDGSKEGHTGTGFKADIKVNSAGEGSEVGTKKATSTVCNPNPCKAGSLCKPEKNSYRCECQQGLHGENCDIVESLSCTFDKEKEGPRPLCLFSQSKTDDFDWILIGRPTPSSYTGPQLDVSKGGKYLYIEGSKPQKEGDKAVLMSAVIRGGYHCFRLFYSMYGGHMGTLKVTFYAKDNHNAEDIWEQSGEHGKDWNEARLTVLSPTDFEVYIEGIIGSGYKSDLAIDEVSVVPGKCKDETDNIDVHLPENNACAESPCQNKGTCTVDKKGQFSCHCTKGFVGPLCEVIETVSCTFDTVVGPHGLCILSQDKLDDFDWRRYKAKTPSPRTGPDADVSGNGHYLYIEASEPTKPKFKARLWTSLIKGGHVCLAFYRHMYGKNTGTLRLTFSSVNVTKNSTWEQSANKGNKWIQERITVQSDNVFWFAIDGISGDGYESDIAIDHLEILSEGCPNPTSSISLSGQIPGHASASSNTAVVRKEFQCNFDKDNCGFKNDYKRALLWKRTKSVRFMGPYKDHSGRGAFLGECSMSKKPGDTATVTSPKLYLDGSGCVTFWYYAYGFRLGSLVFYVKRNNRREPLWSVKKQLQTTNWTRVTTRLSFTGNFYLEFEVIAKHSWGNYAIDDVELTPKSC